MCLELETAVDTVQTETVMYSLFNTFVLLVHQDIHVYPGKFQEDPRSKEAFQSSSKELKYLSFCWDRALMKPYLMSGWVHSDTINNKCRAEVIFNFNML